MVSKTRLKKDNEVEFMRPTKTGDSDPMAKKTKRSLSIMTRVPMQLF